MSGPGDPLDAGRFVHAVHEPSQPVPGTVRAAQDAKSVQLGTDGDMKRRRNRRTMASRRCLPPSTRPWRVDRRWHLAGTVDTPAARSGSRSHGLPRAIFHLLCIYDFAHSGDSGRNALRRSSLEIIEILPFRLGPNRQDTPPRACHAGGRGFKSRPPRNLSTSKSSSNWGQAEQSAVSWPEGAISRVPVDHATRTG
jgi:hypothetical protein